MAYRDTLIWAKNRLIALRGDLYAIETDLNLYRTAIPTAIDAPVTDALQDEAYEWKSSLDRAESAVSYWIRDIQTEIDSLS